jgi:hypothetical protein
VRAALDFLLPYVGAAQPPACWPHEQYTGYDYGSGYHDALRQGAVAYANDSYARWACAVPVAPGAGGYDASLANLVWPWPPGERAVAAPYCASAGVTPAPMAPGPCGPPSGTPPACNFPAVADGWTPEETGVAAGVPLLAAAVVGAWVVARRRAAAAAAPRGAGAEGEYEVMQE